MTHKFGPVPGAVLHRFYDDDAYWGSQVTQDDEFEIRGKRTGYYAFLNDDPVFITGGLVLDGTGNASDLRDFFAAWHRKLSPTFVVTTSHERESELATLLRQHGFAFATPDHLGAQKEPTTL